MAEYSFVSDFLYCGSCGLVLTRPVSTSLSLSRGTWWTRTRTSSSSCQGKQDPRPVSQNFKVERQDHLPKALHDSCEARAGVCWDCVEPIPGPGQ